MRRAIAEAEVGDDMVGEDPTVNRLEAQVAELLGKEAAVYACSGTQSNQMGVWVHCRPGEELLIEENGHIGTYEAGAPAALSGVSVRKVPGVGGMLDVETLERHHRPPDIHFAPTKLLCLENSTNLGGGRAYPLERLRQLWEWARSHGMKVHLDGARLFNACIAQGVCASDVARYADTISICFSKGLGCPMGSILVGSSSDIQLARRARKLFGGALRQVGMMAASAIYALEHHVDRLAEDHANARLFAETIAPHPAVRIDVNAVETNLVFFHIDPTWGSDALLGDLLASQGVRVIPLGEGRLRVTTHLDVTREQVETAANLMLECLDASPNDRKRLSGTCTTPYSGGR
jgi:threonine aldolase